MSYEDIVELLVPELQKRVLMWQDYHVPGGTFRENLDHVPGEPGLSPRHPGRKFKWNAKAETDGKEEKAITNGHTVPVVVAA